jgi:hypothetical protein
VLPAFASEFGVTIDPQTEVVAANPIGIFPWSPVLEMVPVAVIALLGVGLASMLVRYRRSSGLVRLQLRWFVASIAFVVIGLVAAFSALLLFGEGIGEFIWIPVIVAYPTVGIAIGVAILRYRLYAIDRIISRTLGWALVTAVLAGVFFAGLVALQALLSTVTQGQTLAVGVSTLVAFALLQPVRSRLQGLVDRRFDRARVDAQRTAAAFSERLRDRIDLETIAGELEQTVERSIRPQTTAVWIRQRPAR